MTLGDMLRIPEELGAVIAEYEEEAQGIRERMPYYERWGSGKYYGLRLGMIEEFLSKLKRIEGES